MPYNTYFNPAILTEHMYVSLLVCKYRDTHLMEILDIFSSRERIENAINQIKYEYKESIAIVIANSIFFHELNNEKKTGYPDKESCKKTAFDIIRIQHIVLMESSIEMYQNMFIRNRSDSLRNDLLMYLHDLKDYITDPYELDSFEKIIYAITDGTY